MQHGNVSIQTLVSLIDLLNGECGVSAILDGKELLKPKYGDMSLGEFEALVNKLGGQEVAEAILRGEKEFTLVDADIKLFDKNGRRIPSRDLQASVTDAKHNYYLTQPALDYSQRFARLVEYLLFGHEISCAEFAERSERIVDDLRSNDATKNILNGVYLPFCLPKVKINDYGKVLDGMFLTAVGQSYKAQFPHRSFNNYRKGKLTKQVGIVSGSRHERLVEAMSRGIVVGLYFPNCLQGFSVNADHEQMAGLSEKFLLAGGFDAATAMVAYPDILARDVKTPLLDLASLQRQSAQDSLYFRAYDDHLNFDYGSGLGDTHGSFAGGLVVLG